MILWWLACAGEAPDTPPVVEHPDDDCVTDAEFYEAEAWPLLQQNCYGCHNPDGLAASSANVLTGDATDDQAMLAALGESLLLKPTGQTSHGGGVILDPLGADYAVLHELAARLAEPGGCERPGEPPITCDGRVRPGPSPFRRLTNQQYANSVKDLFGVDVDPAYWPETLRGPDFRSWNSSNTVSAVGVEGLLNGSESVTEAIDLEEVTGCAPLDDACLRTGLGDLAYRVFRRPLTDDERALVLSPLDSGVALDEAAKLSIEAMLNSPQFLYIDTSGRESDGDVQHLEDHAIASRLAYFLWNTTPDETLLEAARNGELHTRAQVQPHAERMAQDPRAVSAIAAFHEDWLDLYLLDEATRDDTVYPAFSDDLVQAMRAETELFVTEVVWSGDARFETLLFSRETWVNEDLAPLYGLEPVEGWQRVTLGEDRPGVLTRTGFLAAHSYSVSSAPVKRGYFVLKDMLCEELVVPPDVDMVIEQDEDGATTIRERLQQHQTDTSCAPCHVRIDPLGFGFEHFDALGAWRDNWENGIPVDATGSIEAGDFDGATELIELVGRQDEVQACYATRWFEYSVGRPVDAQDVCTLQTLHERFEASDGDLRALLVDLAMTDAFLYREVGP